MLIIVYTLSGKPNSVHDSEDGEADGKEICVRNSLAWPDPAAASQIGIQAGRASTRNCGLGTRGFFFFFFFFNFIKCFRYLCFYVFCCRNVFENISERTRDTETEV